MRMLAGRLCHFVTNLFAQEDKKRVMTNFFFLSLLQGVNYLLPLLTFPYLTRVLGPGVLGSLAIASSLVAYFNPLTEFGFGFTATREVSIHRKDHQKISEIFSAVMLIKAFMTLLSLVILLGIIFFVPTYRQNPLLFLFTFGLAVGQVLFPSWFFQGMEKLQYVTFLNILARLLFTIAIFVFVRSSDDYLFVPLFQGAGFILSGIISLFIVRQIFQVRWMKPPIQLVKTLLKDSWYIFLSSLISSLYMISAPLLLSFHTSVEKVGYFYGAQRIIDIIKTMLNPLSGAFYPFLSHRAHHQKNSFPSIIKKLSLLIGIFTIFISLGLFFGSEIIVRIILGEEFQPSTTIIRIMSFIPFFVGISTVWGSQTLLPLKKNKVFTLIIASSSILSLLLSLIFLPFFDIEGMAFILLFTEGLIAACMLLYLLKTKFFSRHEGVL